MPASGQEYTESCLGKGIPVKWLSFALSSAFSGYYGYCCLSGWWELPCLLGLGKIRALLLCGFTAEVTQRILQNWKFRSKNVELQKIPFNVFTLCLRYFVSENRLHFRKYWNVCVHQSVLVSALRMYDKNNCTLCRYQCYRYPVSITLSREHFDITKVGCDTDEF